MLQGLRLAKNGLHVRLLTAEAIQLVLTRGQCSRQLLGTAVNLLVVCSKPRNCKRQLCTLAAELVNTRINRAGVAGQLLQARVESSDATFEDTSATCQLLGGTGELATAISELVGTTGDRGTPSHKLVSASNHGLHAIEAAGHVRLTNLLASSGQALVNLGQTGTGIAHPRRHGSELLAFVQRLNAATGRFGHGRNGLDAVFAGELLVDTVNDAQVLLLVQWLIALNVEGGRFRRPLGEVLLHNAEADLGRQAVRQFGSRVVVQIIVVGNHSRNGQNNDQAKCQQWVEHGALREACPHFAPGTTGKILSRPEHPLAQNRHKEWVQGEQDEQQHRNPHGNPNSRLVNGEFSETQCAEPNQQGAPTVEDGASSNFASLIGRRDGI